MCTNCKCSLVPKIKILGSPEQGKDTSFALNGNPSLVFPLRRPEKTYSTSKLSRCAFCGYVPPAPRLVCVETNPGPGGQAKLTEIGKVVQDTLRAVYSGDTREMREMKKQISANRKKRNTPKAIQPTLQNGAVMTKAAPVSYGMSLTPLVRFTSAQFGSNYHGLRMSGRQRHAKVYSFSSIPSFSSTSLSRAQYVDPTIMGGVLQGISKQFQRYVFRKLKYYFVPNLGTNAAGTVLLAYSSDPIAVGGNLTETSLGSLSNSIESSLSYPFSLSPILETGSLLFNYDTEASNASGRRFGDQGALMISGTTSNGDGTTIGILWVEYEVDLFEPGDNATLTFLRSRQPEDSRRNSLESILHIEPDLTTTSGMTRDLDLSKGSSRTTLRR